ncbi:class I SAM-dependent RNA methyltransferase [Turneriella parva]|uniref:23S rRNA m(5)U-1939 methyltransferase n=1 Tax=Turneriella parva (strain ATCC BAA-1111 / DSM 21527 / NCTC 11395 / H) TaxID=869212 RepID=I4B0X3_TURPD|nr:class I SAM-dependent RNA methyltransferase [Turneriella parva]AFM10930.1 23S rRNA m(5)U-1939 methyltransferase [Turneriella parva DSM 21527]
MTAPPEILDVQISGLHANGFGVAHVPGLGHLYVPFAFPGQQVTVTHIKEVRSGQWQGELVDKPFHHCSLAGRCGGCLWPAVEYAAQLREKEQLFRRGIARMPAIANLPINIHAAPQATGYRSRLHLHANFFQQKFEFGFYAKGTRTPLPVTQCAVASPALQQTVTGLTALRSQNFEVVQDFGFGIELIDLVEEGKVLMTLYSTPERRDLLRTVQPVLAAADRNAIVALAHVDDATLFRWQRIGDVQMYTRAGCFQQVNRAQSDTIREILRIYLTETNSRTLLDLYSGSGNYSLPFARLVALIRGFDENQVGIGVAQHNLQQNNITNAQYTCADTASALRQMLNEPDSPSPDLVILDPARFGIGPEVPALLQRLHPRAVALVSNRMQAFTTDARRLLAAQFRPTKLHLVDCFPFTPHWNVVSFWRNT